MILALDCATRTGWARSDKQSGVWDLSSFTDYAERARMLCAHVQRQIVENRPNLIALEKPLGVSGRATYLLNGLVMAAEMTAQSNGVPRLMVAVGTWRKAILGSGRASKADAMRWAIAHGYLPASDDEAEAVCILEWAKNASK